MGILGVSVFVGIDGSIPIFVGRWHRLVFYSIVAEKTLLVLVKIVE